MMFEDNDFWAMIALAGLKRGENAEHIANLANNLVTARRTFFAPIPPTRDFIQNNMTLGRRSLRALTDAGIKTITQLEQTPKNVLEGLPGIGATSVAEIEAEMCKIGRPPKWRQTEDGGNNGQVRGNGDQLG